ncbi:unnamed protein product, partial [Iphiclides podalirius]
MINDNDFSLSVVELRFTFSISSIAVSSKRKMREAVVLLRRIKVIECKKCSNAFTKRSDYKVHKLKHDLQTLQKRRKEKNKLYYQKVTVAGYEKKIECEECDMKFVEMSTLKAHSALHKPFPHGRRIWQRSASEMNELDLIKEVEKRTILYDKSVSGFNKTKLRDEAWKEVQNALRVSEAECKKRWRSLRDSFIKLQRTHGSRTRWPYLNAMRFLLPHIEPKPDIPVKKELDDSDPEEDVRRPPSLREASPSPDLEDDEDSQPSPKKPRLHSTDEESTCQCNRTDPDELFLLSCSPTLKRLSSKRNAVARLKIQQALYEAEFGANAELAQITPVENGYAENGAD